MVWESSTFLRVWRGPSRIRLDGVYAYPRGAPPFHWAVTWFEGRAAPVRPISAFGVSAPSRGQGIPTRAPRSAGSSIDGTIGDAVRAGHGGLRL